MNYEPRERIGSMTGMLMMAVCIGLWLIEIVLDLIPLVGWILAWLTYGTAWAIIIMWFRLCGASISKNKGKNITSFIIGFIPEIGGILNAFPVVIYMNIRSVRKEDEEYNAQMKQKAEQAYAAQRAARLAELDEEEVEEGTEEDAEPEKTQDQEEQEAENEERMERILEAEGEEGQARDSSNANAEKVSQEYDQSLIDDALDGLNNKPDKSDGDFRRLSRASVIMRTGQLTPSDRNDPVLMAAYNKHQSGVREYNPNTQKGYKFNNTNYQ